MTTVEYITPTTAQLKRVPHLVRNLHKAQGIPYLDAELVQSISWRYPFERQDVDSREPYAKES